MSHFRHVKLIIPRTADDYDSTIPACRSKHGTRLTFIQASQTSCCDKMFSANPPIFLGQIQRENSALAFRRTWIALLSGPSTFEVGWLGHGLLRRAGCTRCQAGAACHGGSSEQADDSVDGGIHMHRGAGNSCKLASVRGQDKAGSRELLCMSAGLLQRSPDSSLLGAAWAAIPDDRCTAYGSFRGIESGMVL